MPLDIRRAYELDLSSGFTIRVRTHPEGVQLQIEDRDPEDRKHTLPTFSTILTPLEWRSLCDLYYVVGVYPPKEEEPK